MVLYSPDWTNIELSFILLTVNLFCHHTLIEHGLYSLRYWFPVSNLVDFYCILSSHTSSAQSSAPFFHSSELLPLDHAYPKILVDTQISSDEAI